MLFKNSYNNLYNNYFLCLCPHTSFIICHNYREKEKNGNVNKLLHEWYVYHLYKKLLVNFP